MRAVAFVFVACLSLFTARFVACKAGTGPFDGPTYADVLKNAVNRFVKWRNEGNHSMRCANSMDTAKLEKIVVGWNAEYAYFKEQLDDATLNIDCNYVCTGVGLRAYHEVPYLTVEFNFTIPKVTIENINWRINGTWRRTVLDRTSEFSIVYRDMPARIILDLKLKNEDETIFWDVDRTTIDTDESFKNKPAEDIPIFADYPKDFPFYHLDWQMKDQIAKQLESRIHQFFKKLLHDCHWKRFILGEF